MLGTLSSHNLSSARQNSIEVRKDVKTAFERCKGQMSRTLAIEFGEGVLWERKPIAGALGKISCMWDDGVCLGLRGASGELIVSDVTGVWRTRTVQQEAAQDQWRPENVEFVRWVPWAAKEVDPKIDGERLDVTKMTNYEDEMEKEEAVQKVLVRFMIKRWRTWRNRDSRKGGREPKRRKEEDIGEEDMQIDVAEQDVNLEGQPLDFNEPEGPQEIAVEKPQKAGTEEVSFMKKLRVWEVSSLEESVQMHH